MSSKSSARGLFKFERKEEEGIGAQNNGHTPMVSQLERKAETWMTGDPSHLRNPNDGHPIEPQASEQAMSTVQYTCSALPTTSIVHNPSQNDSPRPSAPGTTGEHTNSQAPRKQRYRLSLTSPSIQFSKSPEPYEYAPLPRGKYTRYLVLQPGKDKEALLCHLHTCALADLSEVETISYVWGSSNKTKRLLCAGKTIPITVNLRDVLRRVRLPDAPRTLWADSICINQEDRKEKSEQVALMGLIFGGAKRTLICLGPDNGQGSLVESLLVDVNQMIQQFGSWDQIPPLSQDDPMAQDPRWGFLGNMIVSPWFSRVWVVQEAALSRDARVLYGSTAFPWLDLVRVHFWLLHKAQFLCFKHRLFLCDVHITGLWNRDRPDSENFVAFLARAKGLRCWDARDRVYAFLGLRMAQVGLGSGPIVVPDYQKPHHEAFHELALEFLKHTNDLCILSAVDHTSETLKSDLPSWVPRWDYVASTDQFGLHDVPYNASRGMKQTKLSFVSSTGLRVRGFTLDRIHFRSKALPKALPTALYTLWEGFSVQNQNSLASLWKVVPLPLQNLLVLFAERIPDKKKDFLVNLWIYLANTRHKSAYDDGERLFAFIKTLRRGAHDEGRWALTADEAAFCLRLCRKSASFGCENMAELEQVAQGSDGRDFRLHTSAWCTGRTFILTSNGYYGLAPEAAEEGDVCCIIPGLRVPVILRGMNKEQHYRLVGEAFIFGLMEGQGIANRENWGLKEEDVILC
ncbi:hypothetical protein H634G_04144 [Metarhizium anisopliae BRIP 53293]|uniref:Heterokaryon incompatibility domain-containing protein n=1 Tax=Metarhizium anisopliae BRIP 53293 TaxID=1291518 RepID=A0A0D9P4Z8_METAN|nr:hypothetical protein H634G_04144 [Metarhizium anisopliae BRIP 53293]KJK95908.1 hypothetical protein H633G_00257 [Metarhizium anisopliae BRIP 53284]